jgi:large subunit ribosomal protein L18
MDKNINKKQRENRHRKVRAKIFGTQDRPRFCVFKSNKHIYAQIINDEKGITLTSASDSEIKGSEKIKKLELAQKVGELLAQKAKDKKITQVVFDRGGFIYQGRIQSLADGARKGGLVF